MTFFAVPDAEIRQRISGLSDPRSVSDLIEMPHGLLSGLANSQNARAYHRFLVPKKAGGHREIHAPREALKEVQRRLARVFALMYSPPACAYGFIADRNTVQNATEHTKARWVLNIDLLDFFPSIHFGRVRGMLSREPYSISIRAAQRIAALCCHDTILPQGAPTSPILANMIAQKLDRQLQSLAARHRFRYSRYADDLTFSSQRKRFPSALVTREQDGKLVVSDELRNIVKANSFALNERKTRLSHYSERQEVTGLVVNSRRANVPRELVRQIRAMLHAWERFGEASAEAEYTAKYAPLYFRQAQQGIYRQTVIGKLSYLAMVKGRSDPVYVELVQRGRTRVDKKYGSDIFSSTPVPADGVAVIATTGIANAAGEQGTGFLLRDVGFVTCHHVIADSMKIEVFPGHDPLSAVQLQVDRFHRDWDLAILRGAFKSKYQFEIGDDSQVRVGTPVRVVGYPNWTDDRPMSVTDSVVQGAYSDLRGARRYSIRDAIFGGNSGGPVLNVKGQVIGVALTGMFQGGGGTENMFIPISYILQLLRQPQFNPFG